MMCLTNKVGSDMDKKVEKQTLEELQARFEALCDEQEQLPREGFAKVFEVLDGMEETFTPHTLIPRMKI